MENKNDAVTLFVILAETKEGKREVLGLKSDAPIALVFAALLNQGNPAAPRVDIKLVDASAEDMQHAANCDCGKDHTADVAEAFRGADINTPPAPEAKPAPAARPGKLDPALRSRAEQPEVIPAASGEVGAMLSVLSDVLASKGGR